MRASRAIPEGVAENGSRVYLVLRPRNSGTLEYENAGDNYHNAASRLCELERIESIRIKTKGIIRHNDCGLYLNGIYQDKIDGRVYKYAISSREALSNFEVGLIRRCQGVTVMESPELPGQVRKPLIDQ